MLLKSVSWTSVVRSKLSNESALVARNRLRRNARHTRLLPEPRVLINPLADMKHKLRRCSRYSRTMRYVVERLLQLRMLIHVCVDVLQRLPGRLQALLKFRLRLDLRFAERHLHAAVRVHFAFARRLDRQEYLVLEDGTNRRHTPVRLAT